MEGLTVNRSTSLPYSASSELLRYKDLCWSHPVSKQTSNLSQFVIESEWQQQNEAQKWAKAKIKRLFCPGA